MSTGRARILIITPVNKSISPGGHLEEEKTMFDHVEHQSTREENKVLAYAILGGAVACAVIGAALVWFFGYYGV